MSKASAYYLIADMKKHDIKEIKKELDTLTGVISVSISLDDMRLAVDYDTSGTDKNKIEEKLKALGFEITKDYAENHIM